MNARRIGHSLRALAGVALAALTFASSASALPDLRVNHPPTWSAPIVLSRTGNSTSGSAFDDNRIFGDVAVFWNTQFTNIGNAAASPTISRFALDGETVFEGSHGSVAPGATVFLLNNSQVVRGGIHTFRIGLNPGGLFSEDSIANNVYARQIALVGADLAMGTSVTRNAPPQPLGGTDAVTGTIYPNIDGMRITGSNPWEIVALRPPAGQDYDLTLRNDGFFTDPVSWSVIKSSALGASATDFIINNSNSGSPGSLEVGVQYFAGASQSYSIEHREAASTLFTSGSSYPGLTLAFNQMVAIHQYQHVPNASVPRIAIELTTTPGTVLRLGLFARLTQYASRNEAIATAIGDASGRAVLDVALPITGSNVNYGIAVYRDQDDGGTAPVTYTLRIRPTPAELSNMSVLGLTTPVNASNGASNWSTPPFSLDGNTNNTNFSLYFSNTGPVAATNFRVDTRLDGQSLLPFTVGSTAPDAVSLQAVAPFTVRGGRHTLSYVLDLDNAVDELNEGNNLYGKQFVWSPLVLTAGTTSVRALPPDPLGGIDAIPGAALSYFNCDGLRTDPTKLGGPNALANVVAAMPFSGADVDLDAFALSPNSLSGFDTAIGSSQRAQNLTDLLVYANDAGTQAMDVGVRRYAGTSQPYAVQNVFSSWIGTIDPTTIGPDVVGTNGIVKAYSFQRSPHATMTVILDNLSGNADLGFSVYQYSSAGPHAIYETLPGGFADAVGPGISEGSVVTTSGGLPYFVIVVWKTGVSELSKSANFRLRIDPVTAEVAPGLPHEVAFAIAGENPMALTSKLKFDLPAAAPVSIDLLDLQGRRVRSLVSGMEPAGSHLLPIESTDDAGQRLHDGAYFVRFTSGSVTRVRKLVVLH